MSPDYDDEKDHEDDDEDERVDANAVVGSPSSSWSSLVVPSEIVLASKGGWNVKRMQNMILIVGPGTPAWNVDLHDYVSGVLSSSSSSSSNGSSEEVDDDEEENEDEEKIEDEEVETEEVEIEEVNEDEAMDEALEELGLAGEEAEMKEEEDEDEDDEERLADEYESRGWLRGRFDFVGRRRDHDQDDDDDDYIEDDDDVDGGGGGGMEHRLAAKRERAHPHDKYRASSRSSMRHSGCINTASWLDCGWRISMPYSPWSLHASNAHYDEGGCDRGGGSRHIDVMDVPWGGDGIDEIATQLLTSGDDTIVNFWDAHHSMGGSSPLSGGSSTITPFSSPRMTVNASSELVGIWRGIGNVKSALSSSSSAAAAAAGGGGGGGGGENADVGRRYFCLPGTVHHLASMRTGHRGNVFHATPVPHGRGKVATCGADGYLRLHDVAIHASSPPSALARSSSSSSSTTTTFNNAGGVESSAIIVNPQYIEGGRSSPSSGGTYARSSDSCLSFSHHFLSPNVGLLCSERGLLRFDVRLPPRSQENRSIVPELSDACRACRPWRLGGGPFDESMGGVDGGGGCAELESAYVFAGGTNDSTVGLYDLRMTGSAYSSGSRVSHVVQKYRPRGLGKSPAAAAVTVSGIDLSRDGRELLVSYEADQVYTFPIFDGKSQPTLWDIEQSTSITARDADGAVPELAAYGGHLNRLTFLKTAKYAGPNDECEFSNDITSFHLCLCDIRLKQFFCTCCFFIEKTFVLDPTRGMHGSTKK
jgi:hypothetical protein